ncbi:hypothetical protein FGD67_20185 [Colwellia sp. M166]|uniref:hypothetical protein n=1 Tax=Colwellia sp. M166 TaxID=2583805 RepID=UPI00211EF1DE|nr:hypothetical protein [Colwellia sp. M166]UUO25267.1 hypothetical protein FGD67_20185 [Colwellia sp. M166]
MSKLNKKLLLSTVSALVLSACGGGGEETKTVTAPPAKVTPTLSLSVAQSSLTINENDQGVISLSTSYNGQSTIDYSVSFSSEIVGVSAEVIDQSLQLNIDELENDHVITLTVMASSTADNLSSEQSIEINLTNSSVVEVIDEVELWTDIESVFKFDDFELALLPTIYAKAAYFNGKLTSTEYQTRVSDFTAIKVEASNQKSAEENTSLSTGVTDYQVSSITETELVALLDKVKVLASSEYNKLVEKVNELALLSDETVPALPLDSFGYVETYGVFSGVIGATSMGTFVEEKWQFSEQYQILNTLIPVLGNTNECSAN